MRYTLALVLLVAYQISLSQSLLPTPKNIEEAYDKGTRSVTGKPGENYWQNTANYDLKISYDPVSRLVTGVADIVYINNSPDTLRRIVFKLYPNLFKKGVARDMSVKPDDLTDGVSIDSIFVDGKKMDRSWLRINGTNAYGMKMIPAGGSARFSIGYHYTLNEGSHIRTGQIEPGAAFIAYSFPRISVYDDIDGWNMIPYLGSKEFYNDFCHLSAAITVPAGFVVWATGDLKNGNEVLSPVIFSRLQQAEKSDQLLYIIDTTDLRRGGITNTSQPYNTWHFDADDVTDFAFAVSDHYIWQSSSIVVDPKTMRRTRVDAAFNSRHHDYFNVASDTRKTVEAMSYAFPAWPFPYPHISVFDGLDQMEYPMMVNDNPVEDRTESITLTDHEVFHTMFPFYMGINETKYAWMDEGWATIGEWLISPMIDSAIVDEYGVAPTAYNAGSETDLPITTLSTETSRSYFTNSYPKPAMGYLFVKDYLGDELFTKALHYYIEQWHGKHPLPNDFFYCMNAGSGKDLNWFWKSWFFGTGVTDLAITSVKKRGKKILVIIANKGGMPMPVDITIKFKDGSEMYIHRNIGVWEKGNKNITISFTASKPIDHLLLGDPHTPDSDIKNNSYSF